MKAFLLILGIFGLYALLAPTPPPAYRPQSEIDRAERYAKLKQRIEDIRTNPHISPADKIEMIRLIETPDYLKIKNKF